MGYEQKKQYRLLHKIRILALLGQNAPKIGSIKDKDMILVVDPLFVQPDFILLFSSNPNLA